jgi:fused signal recognition particle receptor
MLSLPRSTGKLTHKIFFLISIALTSHDPANRFCLQGKGEKAYSPIIVKEEILTLTDVQMLIFVVGIVGLVIAIIGIWRFRSRRRAPSITEVSRVGIHKEISKSQGNLWSALEKSRSRFKLNASAKDSALQESLEEACLASDLGVLYTQEALGQIPWQDIPSLTSEEKEAWLKEKLSGVFESWLASTQNTLNSWPEKREGSPTVLWFVGVNGVGKTTSIAKVAQELLKRGHSVMLAAGDTFRAAASEQLETWAQRLGIPCVRGQEGADSSAVLFDAIQSAKAKGIDFVLCDSAGRLHNNNQLMEALEKNKRVMSKALEGAPHETLLVLDANTGQNMLMQAEKFLESVQVTGLILTKLDGTARGGAIVAVAQKTKLPIRRLGLGETSEAMMAFEPKAFSRALLGLSTDRD